MKRADLISHNDQQKLVRYFQKITDILLHLYNHIELKPTIIQIHSIIDYAHNILVMVQQFYKSFQKKFVSVQVFKKIQTQLNQKNQKINELQKQQKYLKIQLKVMEDKLKHFQSQTSQINTLKQLTLPEKIRKSLIQKEKQTSIEIQQSLKLDKTAIEVKKKRMSLPQLPSSSKILSGRYKFPIQKKKKKSLFVDVPGEGNQVLIQHLMSKFSIK